MTCPDSACGCEYPRGTEHCPRCGLAVGTDPPSAPASELSPPAPASATIDQGKSRHNAGKPPLHLVPYDAVVMVSWVLAFGAEKYAARNWEQGGLSWTDCARAIAAHLAKLLCGQWLDDESGCPHVAHIACNALFLCAMSARVIGTHDLGADHYRTNDRPRLDVWVQTPEQLAAVAKVRAAKGAARG